MVSTIDSSIDSPAAARTGKQGIWGVKRSELDSLCRDTGVSIEHSRSLFRGIYKESLSAPWQREGIPHRLRDAVSDRYDVSHLTIIERRLSQYDGSVKFLLEAPDKSQIEMVLMPESSRVTLCVSSQYGCAQGCVFCHTGRMGLRRNLSAAEIVDQVLIANKWIADHPNWLDEQRLPPTQMITNIVFMGMGEPLDNVPAVSAAISILTDPYGLNMAMRRISVSTSGHLDGLNALIADHPDARLAISVHSPYENERTKIMPINRRWPLSTVIEALRNLPTQQKNGVLLQYTLIRGVNDSVAHAHELIRLVSGLNCKINLIPLNPVGPSRLTGPDLESLEAFRDEIYKSGLRVMVRYSKGQDIAAACGQLVRS